MQLIHTLLFMLRPQKVSEDLDVAKACLHSLEKGTYKTLVVYNQGPLTNDEVKTFFQQFNLDYTIIGEAVNVGIVAGRQHCFQYIWEHYPNANFISEFHLDMLLTYHWEDALVDFLINNDEPVISSGIIDQNGKMCFLDDKTRPLPKEEYDSFLTKLQCNKIVRGFTHPCIHKSEILKAIGGYNTSFLKGKQCYEDDSLLLGYYYYYGTKANWYPKVNYNTVVYHALALQRLDLRDSIMPNFNGLVKQYGAMGLKHLSHLHTSSWHKHHFNNKYHEMLRNV